jgi:hypothetical protein
VVSKTTGGGGKMAWVTIAGVGVPVGGGTGVVVVVVVVVRCNPGVWVRCKRGLVTFVSVEKETTLLVNGSSR